VLVSLFKEAYAIWPGRRNVLIPTDPSGPFFTTVGEAEYNSFGAWQAEGQETLGDARSHEWLERLTPLVESGLRVLQSGGVMETMSVGHALSAAGWLDAHCLVGN